ncbi:hypothetical protein F5Y03DRAFT_403965 [Xylaria venustula]|nr:hypothetical protein F5Y03DRAFT_403965 [Xylaria venustula]
MTQRGDDGMVSGQAIEHFQSPYESFAENETDGFRDGIFCGNKMKDTAKLYTKPSNSTPSSDGTSNMDITLDTLPEPLRPLNIDDDLVSEHQATIPGRSNTAPSSAHTTVHSPQDNQLSPEYLASAQRPPLSCDQQEPSAAPLQGQSFFPDWEIPLEFFNTCLSDTMNDTTEAGLRIATDDYRSVYPTHTNPSVFSKSTSPTMSGRWRDSEVPVSFPGEHNLGSDPSLYNRRAPANLLRLHSRDYVPVIPRTQNSAPSYHMNYAEQSRGLYPSMWPDYMTQSSPHSRNLHNGYPLMHETTGFNTSFGYGYPEDRGRAYGASPGITNTPTSYWPDNRRTFPGPGPGPGYRYPAGQNNTYVPNFSRLNMFTGRPFNINGTKRPHEAVEQYYEDASKRYRAADYPPWSKNYYYNSHALQFENEFKDEDSELEVYDISTPGVETLLLRPSTSTTATPEPAAASAAAGDRHRRQFPPGIPHYYYP